MITLQFDTKFGFGMEWHYMCGYDKLHIFTGSIENYGSTNRIARFCGPKANMGWTKPFDGTRQLRNIGGILPMWDIPYETNTNEVIIGIDLDQGNDLECFIWTIGPLLVLKVLKEITKSLIKTFKVSKVLDFNGHPKFKILLRLLLSTMPSNGQKVMWCILWIKMNLMERKRMSWKPSTLILTSECYLFPVVPGSLPAFRVDFRSFMWIIGRLTDSLS